MLSMHKLKNNKKEFCRVKKFLSPILNNKTKEVDWFVFLVSYQQELPLSFCCVFHYYDSLYHMQCPHPSDMLTKETFSIQVYPHIGTTSVMNPYSSIYLYIIDRFLNSFFYFWRRVKLQVRENNAILKNVPMQGLK